MLPLARLGAWCLVSGLVACGGKASAQRSPEEGGQGGSGSAGRSSGGNASGGEGRAGSSSAGAGGADACAVFDDEAGIWVQVSILNESSTTIYLGQSSVTCGMAPLFSVADRGGAALPDLGDCRASCVQLRTEGAGGCPAFCALPSSVELQPGESLQTSWDGLYRVQGSLPGRCTSFDSSGAQLSCDQAKRIPAGTFTFSALAGTALDCSQTSGGTCSPCTEVGNDGCSTPASLITGKILTARASITLDESYGLGPEPSAGAEAAPGSGAIAAPQVLLVFSD